MAQCKIDRGSAFDCANLEQAGIGNFVQLINKDDLDNGAITEDAVSHEIETITLDTGTYAYPFESFKGSVHITPSSPMRKVTSVDGFDHQVVVMAFDASQLSRENIAKMRFQKVVAIIPLLNGKSIMYGRNVGLRISEYEELPSDPDKGGMIQFTLKTPENDPPEVAPPCLIADTFDITSLQSV
jgi:hypothetical protein